MPFSSLLSSEAQVIRSRYVHLLDYIAPHIRIIQEEAFRCGISEHTFCYDRYDLRYTASQFLIHIMYCIEKGGKKAEEAYKGFLNILRTPRLNLNHLAQNIDQEVSSKKFSRSDDMPTDVKPMFDSSLRYSAEGSSFPTRPPYKQEPFSMPAFMTYNDTFNQHEAVDSKRIHQTSPTEAKLETGVLDTSPHSKPLSSASHPECHASIHTIENHSQSHSIESHSKLHIVESTQTDHLFMPQTETFQMSLNETKGNGRCKELDGEKIKQYRLELLLRMREMEDRIQALEHRDQEKEQLIKEQEDKDSEMEQKLKNMEQKLKEMEAKITAHDDTIAQGVQDIKELEREILAQNIKFAFLIYTVILLCSFF